MIKERRKVVVSDGVTINDDNPTYTLRCKTIDKLNELDENEYKLDYIHYSWSISLLKGKKYRVKKFLKSEYKYEYEFSVIAIFNPYESDVYVRNEKEYEVCKKIGEELGYETITKGWNPKREMW